MHHEHNTTSSSPSTDPQSAPAPEVSVSADGTTIARVDGVTLAFRLVREKPRIRDLDLGTWFEYADPRTIRKLIKSMIRQKKLSGSAVMYSQVRNPEGGRSAREFWLTREQALLVATQAEGAKAWSLTELMAQVFDAVLERSLPPMQPFERREVLQLQAKVDRLEKRLLAGVIGHELAESRILVPLRRIAVMLNPSRTKGERRTLENRIRNAVRHVGKESHWETLPLRKLERVERMIFAAERGAIRAAQRSGRALTAAKAARQGRLPGV